MILPRAREGYDEERSHSSQTVFSVLVTIFTSRLLYSITCVKRNEDIFKYHTHKQCKPKVKFKKLKK